MRFETPSSVSTCCASYPGQAFEAIAIVVQLINHRWNQQVQAVLAWNQGVPILVYVGTSKRITPGVTKTVREPVHVLRGSFSAQEYANFLSFIRPI